MERFRTAFAIALLLSTPLLHAETGKTDTFSAGDSEKTVQLAGRASMILAPGTELFPERGLRLELDGPAGGPIAIEVFRMTRGSVDVRFPASGPRKGVMIRAPKRLAIVSKAGQFRVAVRADTSTMAALEKDALVTVGADWKPLTEGTARTAGGQSNGQPRAILRPPQSSAQTQLLVAGSEGADGQLRWSPVPSARGYVLRVIRDGQGVADKVVFRAEPSSTTQTVRGLLPGAYRVAVAAVDEYGLSSAVSAAGSIRVVGVSLPQGARAENNKIWLRAGQRVGLSFAEGVEMTYGAASYFVPAPLSVGLFRDQPTQVRLRPAGGTQEAKLDLMPVQVSATVKITPALPRWPSDDVQATVEYFARGTEPPDATPRVTVNGSQVDSKWRKHGKTLVAVIPKGTGRGPWIVRVEAVDEDDRVIGRSFVEVVAGASDPRDAGRAAVAVR